MKEIKNVLMVGSTLDVKGGMTTVVQGFLDNEFKKSKLYYIPTHIERSRILQYTFYFIALIKIIFILTLKNIDIVHIHVSERGSFVRKNLVFNIAKTFKKKVIVHMHGAEFKEYYNEANVSTQKKILSFLVGADKVIVLGNSWNEYVKGLDQRIKTIVMPNFVKYTEDTVTFDSKKEINILFLAVVTRRKGIFDLVEAIKLLKQDDKYSGYKIKVIVAGTGSEELKVKEIVKDYNLQEFFEFKGWVNVDDKLKLLSKSQIFVLPSYNEGLPMSILEAMSYGIPVVSTSVGSIEDAVRNNYNGLIIQPGDVNALKESIGYLMANEEVCKEFSKNSKDLVRDVYDAKIYFSNVENMYMTI